MRKTVIPKIGNTKGMLLIEVILVVAVLTVALTLIIQSLTASYRALYFTRDYTQAQILLDAKMFELLQESILTADFNGEGDFPGPYERYRYQTTTNDLAGEGTDEPIKELTVRVSWKGGQRENHIEAATFFLEFDAENADGNYEN